MTTATQAPDFIASDALTLAIAFGGEVSNGPYAGGTVYEGQISDDVVNFDDIEAYDGKPEGDTVHLGFVVYDDTNKRAGACYWEKSDAQRHIDEETSEGQGYYDEDVVFSIGDVILTREEFNDYRNQ